MATHTASFIVLRVNVAQKHQLIKTYLIKYCIPYVLKIDLLQLTYSAVLIGINTFEVLSIQYNA